MRLLIDTNVYLEFFLKRENYDSVFAFFQYAARRNTQTCVSAMSLRDFGYTMHKFLHDNECVMLLSRSTKRILKNQNFQSSRQTN